MSDVSAYEQAQRYRSALETLQQASALLSTDVDSPLNALLSYEGDLAWSAVHTYVHSILDLGMTAEQAIADLNDAPPGALPTVTTRLRGAEDVPLPFPDVPDQPHRD